MVERGGMARLTSGRARIKTIYIHLYIYIHPYPCTMGSGDIVFLVSMLLPISIYINIHLLANACRCVHHSRYPPITQ